MRTTTIVVLISFFIYTTGQINPVSRPDPPSGDWHESFKLNTVNNPDIPVVFYGDSITDWWRTTGSPVFEQYYAPLGTANYGIAADGTQHVLWRILNGEIEGLNPKLIVLKIGTNNLAPHANDRIAKGILNIVGTLRKLLPNTKVLLLGILPRNGVTNFDRIVDINRRISRAHDGKNIFFLNMFDTFRGDVWGVVPTNLFYDGLHLSLAGYQLWADTMNPLFNELIQ